MTILKDFSRGRAGETLVQNILAKVNLQTRNSGRKQCHDILCWNENFHFSVEVKYDYKHRFTGNLAIEVYNTRSNKPSGLTCTKSDIWAICIDGKEKDKQEVYFISTKVLQQYVRLNEPKGIINNAGDGNARIMLYPGQEIFEIGRRVDNLEDMELELVLKALLEETNESSMQSKN